MNTFWHFGDSWTFCDEKEIIFSRYISDYLSCHKFVHLGQFGFSNRQIFQRILDTLPSFDYNDTIFINWSSFSRVCGLLYDPNNNIYRTKSINAHDESNVTRKNIFNYTDSTYYFENNDIEYWIWVANGGIHFYEQESFILFQKVDALMKFLIDKYNIKIYHTFQWDYLDTNIISTPAGKSLFFDERDNRKYKGNSTKNGYLKNIYRYEYHDNDRVDGSHYILGIQNDLFNLFKDEIERVNNNS